MINILSYTCIGIGLLFWFWGTSHLVGKRSVLFKLHSLSISDTLGSMSIVVGLLLQIPSEWPLLILSLISLAIWNTVLGYVLAYCSSSGDEIEGMGDRIGAYHSSEYDSGGYDSGGYSVEE